MSIQAIEEAKELRKEFERLDRYGISQRANDLIMEYVKKYPEGNYREVCHLLGKFKVLYNAIPRWEYWREVADRGYNQERYDLKKFVPKTEGE